MIIRMDELDLSGKRYISSKRAAKENRYHVDYIGQLIRAGKILGSKVWRTWYVETESLNEYLGKEKMPPTQPVIAHNYIPSEKVTTPPVYTPPPAALIRPSVSLPPPVLNPEPIKSRLTYVQDDEPIFPHVRIVDLESKILIKKTNDTPALEKITPLKTIEKLQVSPTKRVSTQQAPLPLGAMAIVGVVTVAASFLASYYLQYHATVNQAQIQTSIHF